MIGFTHIICVNFKNCYKYCKEFCTSLKEIYGAVSQSVAENAFFALNKKWNNRYPSAVKVWNTNFCYIIGHILANPSEKISNVSAFRTKGMKATDDEIIEAVDGDFCPEQAEKLCSIRDHMCSLDLFKTNLQYLILSTVEKFISEIDLVCTVPGMAVFSAIFVVGEIGVDMLVSPTSKHLCSWAGFTPQNDQSAGKKKTT